LVTGIAGAVVDVHALTIGIYGEAVFAIFFAELFSKGIGEFFALPFREASAPVQAFDVHALVTFTAGALYIRIAALPQIGP
jgi:hypothetical protein